MLTEEILKQNIEGLSQESIAKIVELSKNDENSVIASKTREIWDSVDADIDAITGGKKPSGLKSYDYLKNTLSEWKTKVDGTSDYDNLKAKYNDLENKIKEGNLDESAKAKIVELEKALKDNGNTIEKLRKDLSSKETELIAKVNEEAQKNIDLRFDNAFAKEMMGLKFKSNIPEVAINSTIKAAKEVVKSKGVPEFQKDENGNEIIVFRDSETGLLITNKENLQKPLTAGELFKSQISDLIDSGKVQTGNGLRGQNSSDVAILDMTGIATKTDADRAIRNYLKDSGAVAGSEEFNEQYQQIYKENNVSELPTR